LVKPTTKKLKITNDEETEGSYSDSIEKSDSDDDSDEECIFQFDKQSVIPQTKKKSREAKLPFWYEAEDEEHLQKIVEEYKREIKATEETDQLRLSGLVDRRRLPTFIGRIRRVPVFDRDSSFDDFTTLDKIDIFRRDIRPCGSITTRILTRYVVTSWDDDGMPENFVILSDKKQAKEWRTKTIEKYPVSYIYCLPVWQSQTAFQYSVEKEKHDVGYANQPFNYTPYLPKDLFEQPYECEEGIKQ